MAGGATQLYMLLQVLCYIEVFFGAFVVYSRNLASRVGDRDGHMAVVFGAAIMVFGQGALVYTIRAQSRTWRLPTAAMMFSKAMLAVGGISLAIMLIDARSHDNKHVMQFTLTIYAILGLPFAGVIHKVARLGEDSDRTRLGAMSQMELAERQKQVAPQSQQASPAGFPEPYMSAGTVPPAPTWG
mmetsp:Transcript_45667/g.106004  ORF Transcript_45667/g.106004 Transcript_45667/m.106004 type:complete len:185 (-) Transcript_45667:62-616(-)